MATPGIRILLLLLLASRRRRRLAGKNRSQTAGGRRCLYRRRRGRRGPRTSDPCRLIVAAKKSTEKSRRRIFVYDDDKIFDIIFHETSGVAMGRVEGVIPTLPPNVSVVNNNTFYISTRAGERVANLKTHPNPPKIFSRQRLHCQYKARERVRPSSARLL